MRQEGVGHGRRLAVRDGDGLWAPGEAIHAGQEVDVASGRRQWADEIHVDVVEPLLRWREGADARLRVAADLRALAGEAGPCPAADVAIHARPDEPLGHQLHGGFYSRVATGCVGLW